MKLAFLILFSFYSFLGWAIISDQMIEMRVGPDRFVVVVLLEEGISMDEARSAALHRAAELSAEAGDRYFSIQSESTIDAIKTMRDEDLEGQLNQQDEVNGSSFTVPALRMSFMSFRSKPLGKEVFDACDWTECNFK